MPVIDLIKKNSELNIALEKRMSLKQLVAEYLEKNVAYFDDLLIHDKQMYTHAYKVIIDKYIIYQILEALLEFIPHSEMVKVLGRTNQKDSNFSRHHLVLLKFKNKPMIVDLGALGGTSCNFISNGKKNISTSIGFKSNNQENNPTESLQLFGLDKLGLLIFYPKLFEKHSCSSLVLGLGFDKVIPKDRQYFVELSHEYKNFLSKKEFATFATALMNNLWDSFPFKEENESLSFEKNSIRNHRNKEIQALYSNRLLQFREALMHFYNYHYEQLGVNSPKAISQGLVNADKAISDYHDSTKVALPMVKSMESISSNSSSDIFPRESYRPNVLGKVKIANSIFSNSTPLTKSPKPIAAKIGVSVNDTMFSTKLYIPKREDVQDLYLQLAESRKLRIEQEVKYKNCQEYKNPPINLMCQVINDDKSTNVSQSNSDSLSKKPSDNKLNYINRTQSLPVHGSKAVVHGSRAKSLDATLENKPRPVSVSERSQTNCSTELLNDKSTVNQDNVNKTVNGKNTNSTLRNLLSLYKDTVKKEIGSEDTQYERSNDVTL